MRPIDADVLKQHIDKLPALPDGNFAGNHSALKALINMQPTIQPVATDTNVGDIIGRQATIDAVNNAFDRETLLTGFVRSIAVRAIRDMPSAQPELIEKTAYIRGFEQGRTQGMIDSQGGRNE